MPVIYNNNAITSLNGAITNVATSITVTAGGEFPVTSSPDYCYLTITEGAKIEIIKATDITGNVITAVRGQDGTTAQAFGDGSRIDLRMTSITLDDALADNILPADIKTIYESNADTNEFSDAEQTKLSLYHSTHTIASATTTSLSTLTGEYATLTGTTTVTSFGTSAAGPAYTLRCTGSLDINHHATNLIMPNGLNRTMAVGDIFKVRAYATDSWVIEYILPVDGKAITPPSTADVTAAGAVMDSEVDANIKTLILPASTTISAFAVTLLDDADASTARSTLGVDVAGTINYTHPNHTGDVTSTGDGATVIANNSVTLAKMADMATASLLGRNTAATGDPEVLSAATARNILNVADGAEVNPAVPSLANAQDGTNTTEYSWTPQRVHQAAQAIPSYMSVMLVDSASDVIVQTDLVLIHVPFAKKLTAVHAEVATAGTTNVTSIDINRNGTSMLSTKLTIDSGETGSDTAATAAVIDVAQDDTAVNDVITMDVDGVSTTPPKGLTVTLTFENS